MFLNLNYLKREKVMTAKSEKAGDIEAAKKERTFNLDWLNAANALWFLAGTAVGFMSRVLMTSAGVDEMDGSDIE
jgi:hypothetical protein